MNYKGIIFDLDQTLVDTSISEIYRNQRNWGVVYSLIPKFKVYEGVEDVLAQIISTGIKTCIVTTGQRRYAQNVVNHFKISCEFIIDYSSAPRIKPYPDQMLKALDLLNLKSHEVISFGDRAIDIESSKSAGIKSVACLWGSREKELLLASKPFGIIEKPIGMLQYLRPIMNSRKT